MPHTIRRSAVRALAATLAIASLVTVGGCGEAERAAAKANANEITIWTHTAGSEAELAGVQQIIDDYNASPDKKATVKLQSFPQSSYNDSIISASSANNPPCLITWTSRTPRTGRGPASSPRSPTRTCCPAPTT